jgi:nitrate/nitrite-specific signal transduction histidine kinase
MSDHGKEPGTYVRKVREEIRRYAQDLLDENGKLRTLVASYQSEEARLRDELAAARALAARAEDLRARLETAQEERAHVEDQLRTLRRQLETREREHDRLHGQLAQIDEDNRRYSDQFVSLEQQNNNLANLYVASYRLHGTLDRSEVLASLQEIIANLVGSEEMALFEIDEAQRALRLVFSNGVQPETYETVPLDRGLMGQAARSGERLLLSSVEEAQRQPGEEHLTACIPLQLGGKPFGLIAIFRLLPQKSGFEEVDHELFDMLASQAGMALYCTALHERLGTVGAPA